MQEFQIHAIYWNLLDSKLICIDPLVMTMHKVTKTCQQSLQSIPMESIPWNQSLKFKVHCFEQPSCIKFTSLTQTEWTNSTFGNISIFSFWLSLLNKSCLFSKYVIYGPFQKLTLYFQLSFNNQSLVNLRLSSIIA